MALSEAEAVALVDQLEEDAATLHAIVHGPDDAVVPTEGGNVKSAAKAIADMEADIDAALDDATGAVGAAIVLAEAWAEEAEDTEVAPGKYSALHWAAKAAATADSLVNTVQLKGAFDASTGVFPADPAIGDEWIVTVSGTVGAFDLVTEDEIIYGPSGWFVVGRGLSASEILTLLLSADGAASGLDADLLDGQEGGFYRDAGNLDAGLLPAARFDDTAHGARGGGALHAAATTESAGFMAAADKAALDGKLDAAVYTATDVLAKINTVDGAASGLDADLLDGQEGSYYRDASNLNAGTVPDARLTQSLATSADVQFGSVATGGAREGSALLSAVGATAIPAILHRIGTGGIVIRFVNDNGHIGVGGTPTGTDAGGFVPSPNNAISCGNASFRWTEVFATNGTINNSDARLKTPVAPLSANAIAAAKELAAEIGTFQWLESVEKKGAAARHHVGLTVQRALEIMEGHGLDPMHYGFICFDAWEETTEHYEAEITHHDAEIIHHGAVLSPSGDVMSAEWDEIVSDARDEVITEAYSETRPAGDIYSFRMDQLLAFIARGADARLAEMEARLAALESGT